MLAFLGGCQSGLEGSTGQDQPAILGVVGADIAEAMDDGRPRGIYVVVPPNPNERAPRAAMHRTIYLHRHGGTYTRGWDNSSNNVSSIPNGTVTIPPWSYGDAKWTQLVNCVRNMYAPFNVTVTDVDPGSAPHIEAVVSGRPGDIGLPNGVGGVSPFTNDCSVIERAITWNFAGIYNGNVQAICEVVAQETGHALGMDHEYYCPDPMTYLYGCGAKQFRDYNAQCGENSPRTCACGMPTQNSVQHLLAVLGPAGADNIPPNLNITFPANGATVEPGFPVRATASDNVAVSRLDLIIDGTQIGSDSTAPYEFTTPPSLMDGPHSVEVRAYDAQGNVTPSSISVTVQSASGAQCDGDGDCPDGEHCSGNVCVPDNTGQPGGTGQPCETDEECLSGICGSDGENKYCTEICDLSDETSCPEGLTCTPTTGGEGVCWPGGDSGGGGGGLGGGCSVAAGSSGPAAPWLLLGLGLGLTVLARRRRRR